MKLYKSYIFLLMLVMSVFLSGCTYNKTYTGSAYKFMGKSTVKENEILYDISCEVTPSAETLKAEVDLSKLPQKGAFTFSQISNMLSKNATSNSTNSKHSELRNSSLIAMILVDLQRAACEASAVKLSGRPIKKDEGNKDKDKKTK